LVGKMLIVNAHPFSLPSSSPLYTRLWLKPLCSNTNVVVSTFSFVLPSLHFCHRCCIANRSRRAMMVAAVISPGGGGLVRDLMSSVVTYGINISFFRTFEELTKRGIFEPVSLRLCSSLLQIVTMSCHQF
jgi:hypothetical protein